MRGVSLRRCHRGTAWLVVLGMAFTGCGDVELSPPQVFANRSTIAAPADLDLTPQGVVGEQMKALAVWYEDPDALDRVFSFASPGNRVVTGPAERFRTLVESEPYAPLIENQGYVVGSAVELQGRATVLVTLVDRAGGLVAYRFYLRQQKGEPKARWMVDAVYRFTPGAPASAEPDYPTI